MCIFFVKYNIVVIKKDGLIKSPKRIGIDLNRAHEWHRPRKIDGRETERFMSRKKNTGAPDEERERERGRYRYIYRARERERETSITNI